MGGLRYCANGWAAFEDYSRFMKILDNFDGLSSFVHWSSKQESIKKLDALASGLKDQLSIACKSDRAEIHQNLKAIDEQKSQLAVNANVIDPKLMEGIRLWIGTFSPDRMTLRVVPDVTAPQFQVVCNLNKEHFLDENIAHILSGYGTFPSVKLGVLGLITAIPQADEQQLNQARFGNVGPEEGEGDFQRSISQMFLAMEDLERQSRPYRFPSIAVQPIAVFRHFEA